MAAGSSNCFTLFILNNENLNNWISPATFGFNSEVEPICRTSKVLAGHNPEPSILTLLVKNMLML